MEKKREGIEYFVLLLSLLLVVIVKGSGAMSIDLWLTPKVDALRAILMHRSKPHDPVTVRAESGLLTAPSS